MKFQITNKGPARTVTFLGVFAEDETKTFTADELKQYQNMNGIPLGSSELMEETFEIVTIVGDDEEVEV